MSNAAFCEAPILDRDWIDASGWSDEHWYESGPAVVYSDPESHGYSHLRQPVPLLANVEELFQRFAEQWDAETAYLSSVHEMVLHPAYQRIIGLGSLVLPSLLRDLRATHRFWFWALDAITGENPVPADEVGDVPRMVQRWLDWGKERGLIL